MTYDVDVDVDVVVVGGGPVGLTLACELRLAGATVRVLERRGARVPQSRALTIHGRTLEMLQLRGLAERFLARGIPVPSGHFAVLDTRLDFSVFATRFPYTLFLPQTTTEELLEQRARELGVELSLEADVRETGQHADGVTVSGVHDGAPFAVRARYLVGADGARSVVRRQAGIDFPGIEAANTLILGDVVLDAPPEAKTFTAVNGKGLMMVAPLGDGVHHRVVLFDVANAGTDKAAALELGELAASALNIGGRDFAPRDPIWLSRFTDETRLATSYRQGRIFLVGDAAHIHMPAGGQGMNVGMQDAMNLGWKLAGVARGLAPDALLDSYQRERHPVGLALYHNTLAQTALMTRLDERGLSLRATVSALLKAPEANRAAADQISGFGVAYDTALAGPEGILAAATGAHGAGAAPAPAHWPGRRIDDWALRLADGVDTSAYALLREGKWVWLCFDADALAAAPLAPEWMNTVQASPAEETGALDGISAMLLRPDGYADYVLTRR
jgi:2-polyprenyl-6-methoxyphenol hydroxylase-like FAD-dependent oxidoreductase